MTLNQFAFLVKQVVEGMPAAIARHLDNVVVDVVEEPSREFLLEAGFSAGEIDAGASVYGYFVPMPGVSAADMLDHPSRIFIFKNPLEEDFPNEQELRTEIRKTVVHEIAHHFGWSDRDLEDFDDDPDPFSR